MIKLEFNPFFFCFADDLMEEPASHEPHDATDAGGASGTGDDAESKLNTSGSVTDGEKAAAGENGAEDGR